MDYVGAAHELNKEFSQASLSKDEFEDAEVDFLSGELQNWANYKLDTQISPKDWELLRLDHANAIKRWRALDQEMISKQISAQQYADYFQEELNGLLKRFAGVLGEEACLKLFGVRPHESAGIIDPEVLAEGREIPT